MNRIWSRSRRAGRMLGTLLFVLPLFAALLSVAPASVLGQTPVSTKDGTVTVQGHKVTGKSSTTAPQLTAEQKSKLDEAMKNSNLPTAPIPEGPGAKVLTGKPTIAPTALPANAPQSGGPLAAQDAKFFQNQAIPTASGTPPYYSSTAEPSVAVHGNVVFVTWNWGVAKSTDGGNTWTYLDPFSFFTPVNNGFCCDQDVIYDINHDVWIWELQYSKDTTGNTVRFATATTAGVISDTWQTYDFHASQLGGGATDWIDYPNVSISNNYFYYTGNIFCNSCSFSSAGTVLRISLADLHAQSGISTAFHFDSFGMVPTHGATTTMYIVKPINTTTLGVIPWLESSTTVSATVSVSHATYNTGAHTCIGPDGVLDPCARDDPRIKTAWVANGVIGALWDVGPGAGGLGSFTYSYIQGVRINQGTLLPINDVALYANNVAYAFPGVGVNGRGALGTNFMFAGGATGSAFYPSSVAMISDSFNGGAFPGELLYIQYGTNSPGPGANRWGDYLTARAADEYGNTWVGVSFTLQGACLGGGNDCGSALELRYVRWGRQADDPFHYQQPLAAIWRSSDASWHLRNSFTGGPNGDYNFLYGGTNDVPLMCNWKGDGQKYPTVFHKSASEFVFSSSITDPAHSTLVHARFGASDDIPLCGDWTGQGRDTVGVYRPGTATFYLDNSNTSPNPNGDIVRAYGNPGDRPVVGDWNGDGKTKIGIFHPNIAQFVLSSSNATPNYAYQLYFGTSGDMPIAGDWDRTGYQKVGVDRNGSWQWRNTLTTGFQDGQFAFGTTGDTGIVWK